MIVWNRRHACALCYLAGECIYSCSDVFDEFTDDLAASCTVVVNSFLYLACFCCGYSGKGRCMERHPVWLFVFGPGPVFLLVCFLGDETQVWLGDLRVVLFLLLPCLVVTWIAFCFGTGQLAKYLFSHRLCIYQDRATEHLRPNSRKKKKIRESKEECRKTEMKIQAETVTVHAGLKSRFKKSQSVREIIPK